MISYVLTFRLLVLTLVQFTMLSCEQTCLAGDSSKSDTSAAILQALAIFPNAKEWTMLLTTDHNTISGSVNRISDGKSVARVTGTNDFIGKLSLTFVPNDGSSVAPSGAFFLGEVQDKDLNIDRKLLPSASKKMWRSTDSVGRFSPFFFCNASCQFYRLQTPAILADNESSTDDYVEFEQNLLTSDDNDMINGSIVIWTEPARSTPSRSQIAAVRLALKSAHILVSRCMNSFQGFTCEVPVGLENSAIDIIRRIGDLNSGRDSKTRDSEGAMAGFPSGTWVVAPLTPSRLQENVDPIIDRMKAIFERLGIKAAVLHEGIVKGLQFKTEIIYRGDFALPNGVKLAPLLEGYWCRSTFEFAITQHLDEARSALVDTMDMHIITTKVFKAPESYAPRPSDFAALALFEPQLESTDIDNGVNGALLALLAGELHGVVMWTDE